MARLGVRYVRDVIRIQSFRTIALSIALVGCALALVSAPATAAATSIPCTSIGGGKYNCQFYPPGNGISGGTPVLASNGARVGYLNQGTNYVFCQQRGRTQRSGPYFNYWWAYTKANDLRYGWASAVYAKGGSNNGAFGGVPNCKGHKGHPPSAPAPAPRPPRPACVKLLENQRLTVGISFRYRHTLSLYANGQFQQKVLTNTHKQFGTVEIGGATCLKPGVGWRVVSPIGVGYSSKGLSSDGHIRSKGLTKGWGIGIRRGAGGSAPRISLQLMHCGKGVFYQNLHKLLSVPIPGLRFIYSVGRWLGGLFLPFPHDKLKCANNGTQEMQVYADANGHLRVRADNRGQTESKVIVPDPQTHVVDARMFDIETISVHRH
jgi:hypothetical protein